MVARSHSMRLGPKFCTSTLFVLCAFTFVSILLPREGTAHGDGEQESPGRIAFVGKNAIVTANGEFHSWKVVESQLSFDAIGEGYVVIEVDVASLDTGIKRRDNHLRSEDFFEVERWPKARARIHSVGLIEAARYRAKFDLEIHGVKKTVDGEFEVVSRSPLVVRGGLTIDRLDFGVGEPKSWNPMSITNEIPLTFEATLHN